MADELETIRKLIRLATNDGASEEEARTAALKACKLIVEKKVELALPSTVKTGYYDTDSVVPKEGPKPKDPWWNPPNAREPGVGSEWDWETINETLRKARERRTPPSHPSARAKTTRSKVVYPFPDAKGFNRPPDPSRHVVTTKFESFCAECGAAIISGSKAADKHKRSDRICMSCYEKGRGYDHEEYG